MTTVFKYQIGQVLIARLGDEEIIVTVETPYDNGEGPSYEVVEGHDFLESELSEISESQMKMTLEGAERLADLHNKRNIIHAQWKTVFQLDKSSPLYNVYSKSLDLINHEILKLEAFYKPR